MALHIYRVPFVDSKWAALRSVEETFAQLTALAFHHVECDWDVYGNFCAEWVLAQDAARDAGWDGSEALRSSVFSIPIGATFARAFMVSQAHDTGSFIMSPVALPWLEEWRCS